MKKVIQFRDKCIGCGYCVDVAPQSWEFDSNDGKCNLISARKRKAYYEADLFDDDVDDNKKAAEICPVKCIRIN